MPTSFKHLLRPNVVIALTAIVSVAAVAIVFISSSRKPAASYVSPLQGSITEEVDTTGMVKAANTVDLSFQAPGRIAYVGPSVGRHVSAGTTLATLSAGDASAQVESAKAALAVQVAKLDGLKVGTRPESIAVSQAAVASAQTSLTQAQGGIVQVSQDAYVKADDAIHNRVDQFISNPRTSSPSLPFSLSNSQLQSSIISDRMEMELLFADWKSYLASLPADPHAISTSAVDSKTRDYLAEVGAYLDEVAAGLNVVIPNSTYTTATIQTYQSSIATGRANISTEVTSLNTAETAEKSAESGLATAQSQLTLAQAPATATDIAAQEAQVASAQASVDLAQAQLGKTVISAPISGTITVNNAHVGATAGVGAPLISMISDTKFQMEAYVSQTDIAKLKVGNAAQITLDAYQHDAPFSAHVIAVDPAATVAGGVSSYKVTLQFDANDPRVQDGLSGSAKVVTQSKSEALSVPTSAIITHGANQFVLEQTPSGDQMMPVRTGVVGADGMTEVLTGLTATDRIRSFGAQQ